GEVGEAAALFTQGGGEPESGELDEVGRVAEGAESAHLRRDREARLAHAGKHDRVGSARGPSRPNTNAVAIVFDDGFFHDATMALHCPLETHPNGGKRRDTDVTLAIRGSSLRCRADPRVSALGRVLDAAYPCCFAAAYLGPAAGSVSRGGGRRPRRRRGVPRAGRLRRVR